MGGGIDKDDVLRRLRRIEGQVRGLQRMVDDDKSCTQILTQVSSATAALRAVGVELLDEHVRDCVRTSIEQGAGDGRLDELIDAIARFAGR